MIINKRLVPILKTILFHEQDFQRWHNKSVMGTLADGEYIEYYRMRNSIESTLQRIGSTYNYLVNRKLIFIGEIPASYIYRIAPIRVTLKGLLYIFEGVRINRLS
jgi:hypothetical protein